jgi:hypothetical protein
MQTLALTILFLLVLALAGLETAASRSAPATSPIQRGTEAPATPRP